MMPPFCPGFALLTGQWQVQRINGEHPHHELTRKFQARMNALSASYAGTRISVQIIILESGRRAWLTAEELQLSLTRVRILCYFSPAKSLFFRRFASGL
jgi:hypothetical protein